MFDSSGAVPSLLNGGRSAENNVIPFFTILTLSEIIFMVAKKNPNAVALGKLGGLARAASLTHDERSAIAKKAAAGRNAKLSPAERTRIAKLAVQARERKRRKT